MIPPAVTRQPLWLLQTGAALLLTIRAACVLLLPPIGDEAYYWLWGQRPALSYFDHPPLHAWLLGLVSLVFGWNLFSLRALTWLTFAATLWIIWLWSKRLAPGDPRHWFWAAVCIYFGSPLLLVMSSISFNDHLLVVLCLASGHFFLSFVEDWQERRGPFGRLYLAALFLGLAGLTKYNAALFGAGYLIFILSQRELRPLFWRWQTYAAALLSVVMQAPVIWWNVSNAFASLRFHTMDRWTGGIDFGPAGLIATAMAGVLMLGIMLVVPMLRLYRPEGDPFERRARRLAGTMLAVSSLVIAAVSLVVDVYGYWNILAYPLALPLLVRAIRTRTVFWIHVLLGATVCVVFLITVAWAPIAAVIPWLGTSTAYTNYDWDRVAAIVARARDEHPGSFLAATRYTTAAQLAFALHDPNVADISLRHSEFTYWFNAKAHVGQDAIIVAAPFIPIDYARTQFRRTTLLENIEIARFGRPVGSYQLYLAEGYCAGACD